MNLNFKEAKNQDIPLLLKIDRIVACNNLYLPITTIEDYKKFLIKNSVFIVYFKNKLIGSFSYEIEKNNSAQISGIALIPSYQKKGIGTQIMVQILENLKSLKKIWLVTHPKNSSAIRFYLKFGFIVTDWKENYFGNGEPRLLLEKISY